jgi:carbonic anhydrase
VVVTNEPVWNYEGDRGPANWGSLDAAFCACSQGVEQSPIDLAAEAAVGDYPRVEFNYAPRAATVVNTGRSIQVNVDPGSGITIGDTHYELLQFHFHHRSEHTVGGVRYPMELHLVHSAHQGDLARQIQRGDGSNLAVVGILLREGPANGVLAPICARLPRQTGAAVTLQDAVPLAELLPVSRIAWRYRGSLTTPPCTEGVSWIVMTEPVALSAVQIVTFGALYPGNYRPVQPLGQRTLGRDNGGHDE